MPGMFRIEKITPALVRRALPPRDPLTQKWDYGHCLVIGGSRCLLGAAALAARAALRGGAGLVTLALPKSLQAAVYSQVPEALTLPLEETSEGTVDGAAAEAVLAYARSRKVTAVVMGPGLTRQESTARFMSIVARRLEFPMVLDADAINARPPLVEGLPRILTPHRREFARLIGERDEAVLKDAEGLARSFVREHPSCVLVLKGHRTRVYFRDGIWVNPTGNPGMAKGGCGDVLSGILGSFLAQKAVKPGISGFRLEDYLQTALAAVYLHGLSGDLAARRLTQVAMKAGDLVDLLPEAFRRTGIK
jgi:NAD(P)H-hydrate epimerase